MTAVSHMPAKKKTELALCRFKQHLKDVGAKPNADQKRHISTEEAHLKCFNQVTQRLEEYEGWVDEAQYSELLKEGHDSDRLGEIMRAAGRPKPTDRFDAHAIVSGGHAGAFDSRVILAKLGIGIDQHQNGAWLPRSGNDCKKPNNWAMPKAVPHSRTHRNSYYSWIEDELRAIYDDEDEDDLRQATLDHLLHIGKRLQRAAIPPHILVEMRYADLQNT